MKDQVISCPLDSVQARNAAAEFGTPLFVYDEVRLRQQATTALTAPNAFGLSVRFAMKAAPNATILRLFSSMGVLIDASSGYEALRAIRAGVAPEKIQITTQEFPFGIEELVPQGVSFNACSISQLRRFGELFPGREVSVRVNPGLGSGGTNRTNTGGPASSFGIWHEQLDEVKEVAQRYSLRITGLHSHIGSGSDVVVWQRCADLIIPVAEKLPEVVRLSLGGGYKVARMPNETGTDLHAALGAVSEGVRAFASRTGRKLHLEIEPGTFLVANCGAVLTRVVDVVNTGSEGYNFIKIDSGMTEILRPSLYGAQHPIWLHPANGNTKEIASVVVGHCCESGDILTPAPGDSEAIATRTLPEASIGDLMVVGGAGAYCSSMGAKHYNSFPEAAEIIVAKDGSQKLIRKREPLENLTANEVLVTL